MSKNGLKQNEKLSLNSKKQNKEKINRTEFSTTKFGKQKKEKK